LGPAPEPLGVCGSNLEALSQRKSKAYSGMELRRKFPCIFPASRAILLELVSGHIRWYFVGFTHHCIAGSDGMTKVCRHSEIELSRIEILYDDYGSCMRQRAGMPMPFPSFLPVSLNQPRALSDSRSILDCLSRRMLAAKNPLYRVLGQSKAHPLAVKVHYSIPFPDAPKSFGNL
jgi:hypothetical protein